MTERTSLKAAAEVVLGPLDFSARTISERFTGEVRWLGVAGTTTLPPKLQQRVEVTEHGPDGSLTYEWRDVPFDLEEQ